MSTRGWILILSLCTVISSCGTYVPDIREYGQPELESGHIVQAILTNITCEVQDAVYDVIQRDKDFVKQGYALSRSTAWLDDWGVQIGLSITIDEKGSINPTVNGLPPSPASAVFNILGAVSASSDATRISKLGAFHTVKELSIQKCPDGGRPGGLFLMQSDLKLKEWLFIAAAADSTGFISFPNDPNGPLKQNVISHQVTFVITTTGQLTPGWKLTRAEVNQAGTFLSAQRVRTHDLTITLGPLDKSGRKAGQLALSNAAANVALANEIGISVANNLRAISRTNLSILP